MRTETDPIWILQTTGRPEAANAVLNTCARTMLRPENLLLYVDGFAHGEQYDTSFFDSVFEPKTLGIGAAFEWLFKTYPLASSYGWLADDTYPQTESWDAILESNAGRWRIAYANDGWLARDYPSRVSRGFIMTSGLCWAGELVRAVGRLDIPPEARQAYIDVAWLEIVRPMSFHRYVPTVSIEHRNWRTGKRERDRFDALTSDEHGDLRGDIVQKDGEHFQKWISNGGVEKAHQNIFARLLVNP